MKRVAPPLLLLLLLIPTLFAAEDLSGKWSGTLLMAMEGDHIAMRFVLTLEDGRLKGNGQSEFEGRKMTGVLDVTRSREP